LPTIVLSLIAFDFTAPLARSFEVIFEAAYAPPSPRARNRASVATTFA
jgi:hypothetical protein